MRAAVGCEKRVMYEHHREELLSPRLFLQRLARHGGWVLILVVISLAVGTLGFHFLIPEGWIDGFLDAAMLLGGMGPTGQLSQAPSAGKLFAAFYALYAGLVFLIAAGMLFAPVFHRMLHRFHLEIDADD